jgi:hypothetical protein
MANDPEMASQHAYIEVGPQSDDDIGEVGDPFDEHPRYVEHIEPPRHPARDNDPIRPNLLG